MINILYSIPLFEDTREKDIKLTYINEDNKISYVLFFIKDTITHKSIMSTDLLESFKGDIIDYISPSKIIDSWYKYIKWIKEEVVGTELLEDCGINYISPCMSIYQYIDNLKKNALDNIKKNILARKIQQRWRFIITNPTYIVCQNRLLYEYNNLKFSEI